MSDLTVASSSAGESPTLSIPVLKKPRAYFRLAQKLDNSVVKQSGIIVAKEQKVQSGISDRTSAAPDFVPYGGSEMEKPVDGMNTRSEVGHRLIDQPEHPPQGVAYASEVITETVQRSGQLKRGRIRHFEVYCDETARIGGDDKFPSPMNYVAMGTGF